MVVLRSTAVAAGVALACAPHVLAGPLVTREAWFDAVNQSVASIGDPNEKMAFVNNLADWRTDKYEPRQVECPSARPTIRPGNELSPEEKAWLSKRRPNTVAPMRDFLKRVAIADFDADAYIDQVQADFAKLPNVAVCASGGGYRAMLNGGGAIKAFDARTGGDEPGSLAGLLQSSTYLAGLSGGSWLVGSLYVNNFTDIGSLQSEKEVWELSHDIFVGPPKTNIFAYWMDLLKSVHMKAAAGFPTTVTDIWARALAWQFVNAPDGGPALSWSSIADQADFRDGKMPMPIVVADARGPGETIVSTNTTIFEFNPWEMGSFDRSLSGFAPLRFLGSNFSGGAVAEGEACYEGFDNAGFVMGTSSSLFNGILPRVDGVGSVPGWIRFLVKQFLTKLGADQLDIADYRPNPFFGYGAASAETAAAEKLTLVDGGEDGENVPFHPLIQDSRAVDVVFTTDSSSDINMWPGGKTLIKTAERNKSKLGDNIHFPEIPDNHTIVNLGLNSRPTIFGCKESSPVPLIVWLPNAPYSYMSNVNTFDLKFSDEQRDGMIQNGVDIVTQAQGKFDAEWPACVGCAMLQRSFQKTGTAVPAACQRCFDRYCWNGETNTTEPADYKPSLKLADTPSAA